MFSDRFGLTQAVIDETKTMTRRVVPKSLEGLIEAMSVPLLFIPERIIPKDISPEAFVAEIRKAGAIMYRDKGVVETKNIKALADLLLKAKYKPGEEVAVAQNYSTAISFLDWVNRLIYKDEIGWTNKMYVRADLMPHHIRITNVRVERLQDISNGDCMREGIYRYSLYTKPFARPVVCYSFHGDTKPMPTYKTPREAFVALIDKINGKGTWEKNPWVFVYEFKLVM